MAPLSPLDWFRGGTRSTCRSALSVQASLETAVREVAVQLRGGGYADLALVFVSNNFASDLPRLLPLLQEQLKSRHWLGCSGGGVIGTTATGEAHELEQKTALSVTLFSLPGVRLQPFAVDTGNLPDLDGPAQQWQQWMGIDPSDCRSLLLLIDPTSRSVSDLISGLDYAFPGATTLGGIAAPHNAPHGSLLVNDRVVSGAAGISIGGDWAMEAVVAQGCRPIGPVFAIEQASKNILLELSHGDHRDNPVACLQRVLSSLSDEERELVRHSLFLGIERRKIVLPGTGEKCPPAAFLVRNLIGVDPGSGAVAVADRIRTGQNVQFQLREAEASRREANQLLKLALKQDNTPPPVFALLLACLGRGSGLYGGPDGDVSIARALQNDLLIAGVFCNGEIGPIAGATHLHGYTACWGLLRYLPIPHQPRL